MNTIRQAALVTLLAIFAATAHAQAQTVDRPVILEGLVGAAVPTFDITDAAETGPVFGGSLGFWATPDILLLAEFDFGTHGGAEFMGVTGPDVDVIHTMAKAGYLVHESNDGKLSVLVNAGAGVMAFSADAPGAETNSYFAINAGAKIYYMFNETAGLVASPQGDIAFVDEADGFTGSTAWVWPITAGLAFRF